MISKLAYNSRKRGFTFVEVLVALVIIAVGVAGLVSLQRTFMQSSVRAAERATALALAQEQLEQMRFQVYSDIASGTDTVVRDDRSYSMQWSVADQYFNTTWVTATDPNAPTPLPPQSDAKAVNIQVDWVTRGGDNQTLTLEGWLGRITMRDGGLMVTAPPPRNEPKVVYNPGAAPEVIAVRLTEDDNAVAYQVKETTRPTPQVLQQGDKLTVRFDTVTYDEATQTQRVEDFITINCSCEFTGIEKSGKTPYRLILKDGRLVLDPDSGKDTIKMTGVVAPGVAQPALCTQCCADHHDNYDMVLAGNFFKYDSSRKEKGNHRHFRRDESGNLIEANQGAGNDYDESCRMRRVDGFYQMYPDWQLKAITATSASYLVDPIGADTYTQYVRDVVKSLVMGTVQPAPPSGRDVTVTPGSYQMIGRGVYLDHMTPDHESAVRLAILNNEADWISKVPFYEVNLTLLGEWESTNTLAAPVTNEPIETIVDVVNKYYGTYSRGRVDAKEGGTATVTLTANAGNASVLGNQPIHPDEIAQSSSSLNVTVNDQADNVALYSITGNVNCLQYNDAACKPVHYRNVTVTATGLTCSYDKAGDAATGFYSCDGIPAGTSTVVSFSKPGFTFTPSSITVTNISSNVNEPILMKEN